jgi:drug/metabolite transporter (DMT)-like permease
LTGQAIAAFVTLRGTVQGRRGAHQELRDHVGDHARTSDRQAEVDRVHPDPAPRPGRARSCAGSLKDISENRQLGDVTTLANAVVPVLAVLGAWLVLGEAPGWLVAVGGVFVVAAGILIVDPRAAFSSGRVGASPLLAFVAVLCFASRDVVVRGVDVVLAAVAGSALSLVTAAVLLVGVNAVSARTEIIAAVRNHLGPLLVPGLFMAVGFTSLIAGFAQGRVAVVSTMAATQSVWAVIMARLFLDRSEWDRRVVIASLLATAGGIVVAVGA